MSKYKTPLILLFLIVLNGALAAGVYYGHISLKTAFYALWAEGALIAASAFFIYAKHLIVFFVMLLLAGSIMTLKYGNIWVDYRIPVTFWGLYSVCWLFYFEFGKTRIGQWIRHRHPLQSFLFYLFFMGSATTACFVATATLFNGWNLLSHMPDDLFIMSVAMAAIIPTVTIGALRIIDIIGAGHAFHFLIGTYHRPISQDRIVLFLDMVGSSSIAEKLSPKKSMAFIARFIFDASLAFRIKGGDIVNYTGDGLVVLWPLSKADKAVESVEALSKIINQNRNLYKNKFGIIPSFRIGIHGGEVIMSQIGEEKLFLGLYGDVVNTAARLEQMCKDLSMTMLFSKTVRQYLSVDMKERAKHLGKRDVRGREEKIDVFTIE